MQLKGAVTSQPVLGCCVCSQPEKAHLVGFEVLNLDHPEVPRGWEREAECTHGLC